MNKKKVLIFGTGRMGRIISKCMSAFGNHVISTDKDPSAADSLEKPVDFLVVENEEDYKRSIEICKPDLIISSLPYFLNESIATEAINQEIAYCDLGGSVPVSDTINKYAEAHAKKPVITDLGLAPGWVNILAEKGCDSIKEKIIDVKTMVGGLPDKLHNPPFNYTATWSIDGLINEYVDDCVVLIGNQVVSQRGMDGLEEVYCRSIDKKLEAFYTSGGASHSIQSMLDRGVESFCYKTLRYKGHNELIKTLLKSKVDDDCVKQVFEKVCAPTTHDSRADLVIIKCIVTGESGKTWDKEFLIRNNNEVSAMQKATSFGLSSVAQQIINEDIKGGKLSYKDVDYDKFMKNISILIEVFGDSRPLEHDLK